MRRAALTLGLVVAACVGATTAHAQDTSVGQRRVGVRFRDGAPEVAFSAMDLANHSVREKLSSGLLQTIVMRVYAYRENGQPITVAPRSCRVAYDLWEEVYRVQVQDSRTDHVESFGTIDAVLERCLIARHVRVGTAADYGALAGDSIYFAVLLEVNPISPDTVHRLRRWLSRPAGGGREGDAFFGSFVSLFVNRRIGSAERTLRFRSQLVRIAP